tara:strand:+ start:429 stop:701 length:273 start_codon:yes stop_codon:yes gene_type:complete
MDSQSALNKDGFFEQVKANFGNFGSTLSISQQSILKKVWKILTFKWQWQIILNSPILLLWILDKTIPSVHQFDMQVLHSLLIPEWAYSFM